MTPDRKAIVIIGGGASGVLLAAHLLRDPAPNVRVTLIERRGQPGQGMAYSSRQLDHVLNVPATNMSAFADDPEHFWRWLRQRHLVDADDRFTFVPRRHYGDYLTDVLTTASASGQLNLLAEAATDLRTSASGVEVALANGTSVVGHAAVLAVGHEENPARSKNIAIRAGSDADTPLDPRVPVLILGSGLSMVDAWLTLAGTGHRGPITIVSRHGLLPQRHQTTPRMLLEAADVPFGTDLHYFQRWFRDTVAEAAARGEDWRSVVDGLRPFNQRIWQGWSAVSRRRFLAHVRPFWNVHRHRLPPELYDRLMAAIGSGQVRLRAGRVVDLERAGEAVRATIQPRGGRAPEQLEVARVYDCGGVTVDVEKSSNPVIRALIARGVARPDPLHIGLDVTTDCAVIDASNAPAERLFALGPLTRGTFFEIEAIPDIRLQAADLAARLRAAPAAGAMQRVR